MTGLQWLTARPIAHRGLHDVTAGVIENSAGAASAAIAGNYAIETDLQLAADDAVVVFHDETLDRLTNERGPVGARPAAALQQIRYTGSRDRILTLRELCDLVAGRVPLVLELKSAFDGNTRIAHRTVEALRSYSGPVALMSFDPDLVEALRHLAPSLPRGIVAEGHYDHPDWRMLPAARRRSLTHFLHAPRSRPQFIAYRVGDLPAPIPMIARVLFGLPLLTWTVRTAEDQARAARYADQIIFEGFRA